MRAFTTAGDGVSEARERGIPTTHGRAGPQLREAEWLRGG